uniref:Uncharacterized protein n=1 Tax=Arundo donax TaxID=35708 RepID=A0A0A9AK49_ARUDO
MNLYKRMEGAATTSTQQQPTNRLCYAQKVRGSARCVSAAHAVGEYKNRRPLHKTMDLAAASSPRSGEAQYKSN